MSDLTFTYVIKSSVYLKADFEVSLSLACRFVFIQLQRKEKSRLIWLIGHLKTRNCSIRWQVWASPRGTSGWQLRTWGLETPTPTPALQCFRRTFYWRQFTTSLYGDFYLNVYSCMPYFGGAAYNTKVSFLVVGIFHIINSSRGPHSLTHILDEI